MESGIQDETSIFGCKAVFSAGEPVWSRSSLGQYPAGRIQILWAGADGGAGPLSQCSMISWVKLDDSFTLSRKGVSRSSNRVSGFDNVQPYTPSRHWQSQCSYASTFAPTTYNLSGPIDSEGEMTFAG